MPKTESFEQFTSRRGGGGKAKHELSHIRIEPAENGHVVEHHFREPRRKGNGPYIPAPEPERMVFATPEEVGAHVIHALGGKAPKAEKAAEEAA